MVSPLPTSVDALLAWDWSEIEPHYHALNERQLDEQNVEEWLADWSQLSRLVAEMKQRLYVAKTSDTSNQEVDKRFSYYIETIEPPAKEAEQALKEKLLDSQLQPTGFEIPLKNMQAEASLFRAENLPLAVEEEQLAQAYYQFTSNQSVEWEGQEITLIRLMPVQLEPNRERREKAWRLAAERRFQDRDGIFNVWKDLYQKRQEIAANTGMSSFRDYRWQQLLRFDYSPEDCTAFYNNVRELVVPLQQSLREERRKKLGVETLRPWDLLVDIDGLDALKPFEKTEQLIEGCSTIFHRIDPQLGEYFDTMQRENLLDLDNRKGKAPGGYCTTFPAAGRPFIFMNSVGLHSDLITLLHEGGHAFHDFEMAKLPYFPQATIGSEIAEVASQTMELLAIPHLSVFYNEADSIRASRQQLERVISLWTMIALTGLFQDWLYENPDKANDPDAVDAQYLALYREFNPNVDLSGLESLYGSAWQSVLHLFVVPFYLVEYGLAFLGAVQIWSNSLDNQADALAKYRRMLALGGTKPLPELYASAGASLSFDTATLEKAVQFVAQKLEALS